MTKRLPPWMKKEIVGGRNFLKVEKLLEKFKLNTVCQEAHCPNRGECYGNGTVTFLIMGDICTRNCIFCAVKKGIPSQLDPAEPGRIAKVLVELNLEYIVITSVSRDDLEDGGASHFAKVIREIHWENSLTKVEVLIPDFGGSMESLKIVLDAFPDVLGHNIETVPRLFKTIRPKADYKRSLQILLMSKISKPGIFTKSSLMVGLGETRKEILKAMEDLRKADCDFLTLGQYLAPSKNHLPTERFVAPGEFETLKEKAFEIGFKGVISGPVVRSSYLAESLLK